VSFDAIVVGARCAGAPAAMLLARRGCKVLLVDAGSLPGDMPFSTHLIWQSGAERLKRWGLLDEIVASGCPPVRTCLLDFGPIRLTGEPIPIGAVRDAYAPRRSVLDPILLNAAIREGVEFRPDFRVTGLSLDADRADSVRVHSNATTAIETARIVIGADGRNSQIARIMNAGDYDVVQPLQGTYFAYWRNVKLDCLELHVRPGRGVYAFPTNDELTLVGVNWAIADFKSATADLDASYRSAIADCAPHLNMRLEGGFRESRFVGGAIGNFLRKPWGPGWALVGDAGLTMDPCTAAGINNAFRDVELLVEAVTAGLSGQQPMPDALAGYHAARDGESKPIYDFTCELAAFAPSPPHMVALLGSLMGNAEQTSRFLGVLAQTVSPVDFFSPDSIGRLSQVGAP
jgi:2-polyprenyl-6-methoxyphenol hydroxylase-like FAD-dependent oxidoreductase